MLTKAKILLALGSSLVMFGCATGEKAELESSRPEMAIEEVQKMRSDLEKNNVDFLAHSEFMAGTSDLNEAMEDLRENDDNQEILDSAAMAKAHFLEATKIADKNRSKVQQALLDARSAATMAGTRRNNMLSDKLHSVDEDLRDETDLFTENLSVSQISSFQKKYQELEVEGVQHRKLGQFRVIVSKAEKNDADDLAPNTLKKAQADLQIAENMISQNSRRAAEYNPSVIKANKSAKLLDDVMNKLMGEAKGSPEKVALKLVYQERKLGKLSETVGNLAGDLALSQQNLAQTSDDLANQRSQTLSAQSQVRFQAAMDAVRKNFSKEEAEVYQQGDRLILRLKKLNFKTGSASIPKSSIDLLSKVDRIISDIKPEAVVVQGHTDSTGSADLNKKLSQERAKTVAKYLSGKEEQYKMETKGFGSDKPLASNKSTSGRTMNRRVDIVIDAK